MINGNRSLEEITTLQLDFELLVKEIREPLTKVAKRIKICKKERLQQIQEKWQGETSKHYSSLRDR